MRKLEQEVVTPDKPILYRRYVDDIYRRRKKGIEDTLFKKLNEYHPNMKFTIEENPEHFLDTTINRQQNTITTSLYTKPHKLPILWTSRIPSKYKKNAIRTELYRAREISSNFEEEIQRIRQKFTDAGFPVRFINSVIKEFNEIPEDIEIPNWLFEDRQIVIIRLPYCETNEKQAKQFTQKLETISQDKYLFRIVWQTKKVRSLFPLKDRNTHISCIIYKGTCSCGDSYIGETDRNATIRWSEHDKPSDQSEPAKHIKCNTTHTFTWEIICRAPMTLFKRRILYIIKHNPVINDQKSSNLFGQKHNFVEMAGTEF